MLENLIKPSSEDMNKIDNSKTVKEKVKDIENILEKGLEKKKNSKVEKIKRELIEKDKHNISHRQVQTKGAVHLKKNILVKTEQREEIKC